MSSPQSSTPETCSACGGGSLEPLFETLQTPVLLCELWPDEASAVACPRGDIRLALCGTCGLIENHAFRPELVHYSDAYENSLEGSALFKEYQEALAQDVIERHGLRHKRVMEVGCGNGSFLLRLCEETGNTGLGFDPSYPSELPSTRLDGSVQFHRAYFGPGQEHPRVDIVVSRQVLEHIPEPRPFLSDVLKAGLAPGAHSAVVLEVPNTEATLRNLALWEVTYEHCTYFTRGSLARLLASCGFDVIHSEQTYADQFITLDARPSAASTGEIRAEIEDLESLKELARSFAANYADHLLYWTQRLQSWATEGQRVALWGSGTRGISFLNLADTDRSISTVIDVNPRKHGKHLPGTGQMIVGPDSLKPGEGEPDVVLVVNPIYREEITRDLRERGLSASVQTLEADTPTGTTQAR
ncbi:MAG TPA: methyltransferase domain-containing protein [Planctomycetes bacterium]|nr:methyltransferase domain-containing protein [Planctomycetota bacterium]